MLILHGWMYTLLPWGQMNEEGFRKPLQRGILEARHILLGLAEVELSTVPSGPGPC